MGWCIIYRHSSCSLQEGGAGGAVHGRRGTRVQWFEQGTVGSGAAGQLGLLGTMRANQVSYPGSTQHGPAPNGNCYSNSARFGVLTAAVVSVWASV